ncbi:hypothetical protein QRO11_18105 [Paracidovorax citrulli]|uniref:hypothetical protein n=2 Tax=Paracidovorax citrulli TaxID=80869 RepID=UPI0005FC1ABB|nr:hypothetical protein [Paracidovorax citrulli]QCX11654.1 hypothetical protein APS58_2857 [Paracidovorax citrulli]UEG45380.1 hypothetical protein LKW27_17260 [Paracidovorax citrulli]UMT87307.1 hypothetical protein FRC90_03975 [Paracidovorax citrulli]UMT95348.1 hypothetical protein FRC97_10170 [Paracidovorax citrulli]WIY33837.1 hypothetical protein QRO11_18105 [Paracidovorax citrulli]
MDHFHAEPSSAASRMEAPSRPGIRPGVLAAGATVIVLQIAAMAWVLEDHVRHAEQQQHAWVARGLQSTAGGPLAVAGKTAQADAGWAPSAGLEAR